jgi:OOP family OmpA-OmpF porin
VREGSELEELRDLLVRHERGRLDGLESRLDDERVRADELAEVLPGALERGAERDHEKLTKALASPVAEAMHRSVRSDPQSLADALFPVMGPAIRKAIVETVRGMIESTNKAIEASLSWQGLRWRFEALRSGKSFAEIALVHSLVYRVEQLLLIHKETGLLLRQLVAPEVATQDADMVSGMLTAIRDFVHDSFGSRDDESLNVFRVGELEVLVEDSPHAALAAVVRGEPPHELQVKLQEALEMIAARFAEELPAFEGDASEFEQADDLLEPCLEARHKAPEKRSRRMVWLVWAVVLSLLAAIAVWRVTDYLDARRWRAAVTRLEATPGIVVTGVERRSGKVLVSGLRDPFADEPSDILAADPIDLERAELHFEPYQSLDAEVGHRRLQAVLEVPEAVETGFVDGRLQLSGEVELAWYLDARRRLESLPWVKNVDRSDLRLHEEDDADAIAGEISSQRLYMPLNSAEVPADALSEIERVAGQLRRLATLSSQLDRDLAITVIGHTDASGGEAKNSRLSESRARAVADLLVGLGVPNDLLTTRGVATSVYLQDPDPAEEARLNRRVTFDVQSVSR